MRRAANSARFAPALVATAFFAAVSLAAAAPAAAETVYEIDLNHSDVSFQIRHLMSKVRGAFNEFSGTIVRNDEDLSKASVEFRIVAASIDTRNESRDEHLRSGDFFDVATHPEIVFKSTAVEKVSDNQYRVTGQFSLHGVTKEIVLPVQYEGEVKDPRGTVRAGFSVATRINRKDYGMEWNRALDTGGYLLSEDVVVEISIEAKQKAPEPAPVQQ